MLSYFVLFLGSSNHVVSINSEGRSQNFYELAGEFVVSGVIQNSSKRLFTKKSAASRIMQTSPAL